MDSAERRVVNAQSDADRSKERQAHLEQELQNADTAFCEEKAAREKAVAEAHATIGALRNELQSTNLKVDEQGNVVRNVAGISQELRTAKQDMEE